MTWNLHDVTVSGPALPDPFLRFELEAAIARLQPLSRHDAIPVHGWDTVHRQLRALGDSGGPLRVHNHVIVPLALTLGYQAPIRQDPVATREGPEDGGWLLTAPGGDRLRAWSVGRDTSLDAPHRRGRAYRFSPARSAHRVLLATGEPAGLLTDGSELRLLLSDPARPDSHVAIVLSAWRTGRTPPDSFRMLLALAAPHRLAGLPDLLDAARLAQAQVTVELRQQARGAVEGFVQAVLDQPANAASLRTTPQLPARLWEEGLILIYRLLFILRLESSASPARGFSFASTRLWRSALSPNQALGPLVRRRLDLGHDTGRMLEDGLRALFRVFRDGLSCNELSIAALGGALFGDGSTALLDRLAWGDHAVALLLDRLLWTAAQGHGRRRVHYGALDVEDLGRIYEALLELEPGIAATPMTRLRRGKLEAVVPAARPPAASPDSQIAWVEEIPAGRFFLRAGLGRKATGAYYTPHAFVRFLVRETLAPLVSRVSPENAPNPAAILTLKVVDPAIGSGHFLVEACRFLGDALYAACRSCDERASTGLSDEGALFHARLAALPDQDLPSYLPSRVCEGSRAGVSQERALALCRRLVAVHCLYGVDRNRLAVELAKLSLWLESYAEGLPLTFLDHRLVRGDSLAGPFFARMTRLPVGGGPLDPLLARGVSDRLATAREAALAEVAALEATIGRDVADLMVKAAAAQRLDAALEPLRQLARAWSGAVMLARPGSDDEWLALATHVADHGTMPPETPPPLAGGGSGEGASPVWHAHRSLVGDTRPRPPPARFSGDPAGCLTGEAPSPQPPPARGGGEFAIASPSSSLTPHQAALLEAGRDALPWDLTFPEAFLSGGFDAVLGNPPWDVIQYKTKEFVAAFDLTVLDAPTRRERAALETATLADPSAQRAFDTYRRAFEHQKRLSDRLYRFQRTETAGGVTGGNLDLFRLFAERQLELTGPSGAIGVLMPSAFHANEGSTAIRRLYLQSTDLTCCLSFENRRKLFDIDSRFRFDLLIARRPGPTRSVRCAFYLDRFEQINDPSRLMIYDAAFIETAGGNNLTLVELRGPADMEVARHLFSTPGRLGPWCRSRGIQFGNDLHMTADAGSFLPIDRASKQHLLHEGKTFHQFTDRWDTAPRYAVSPGALTAKPALLAAASHYRLVFRDIARSSDEHTMIAAIAPPGVVFGHTATVERAPAQRPHSEALVLCALLNSHPFDWLARLKAGTHLSLYLLDGLPVPAFLPLATRFLAHGALRLSCNHLGYAALWRDQLGQRWAGPPLPDPDQRWRLRAAIDAVVAQAYGLSREAYARVLAGFSHKSFVRTEGFCLAAFDALAAQGLEAFCRQLDPCFDHATVTTRPIASAVSDGDRPTVTGQRRRRLL